MLFIITALFFLLVFDLAALRWGANSSDSIENDELKYRHQDA